MENFDIVNDGKEVVAQAVVNNGLLVLMMTDTSGDVITTTFEQGLSTLLIQARPDNIELLNRVLCRHCLNLMRFNRHLTSATSVSLIGDDATTYAIQGMLDTLDSITD